MKASDIQKIISEVVQGALGLLALAAVVFFQANHQPVPDIIYLVLGASLLAFGLKIGLPLSTEAATAPVVAPMPAQPVQAAPVQQPAAPRINLSQGA